MDNLAPKPFDSMQLRHLAEAREFADQWLWLNNLRTEVAGAMGWKKVKGKEYLVRYWWDPQTKLKHMTSVGPRGPETEAEKEKFDRSRAAIDAEWLPLKERLEPIMRVSRALRLGRMRPVAAKVLRTLNHDLLGPDFVVAGDAAVHLYEHTAGVALPKGLVDGQVLEILISSEDPRSLAAEILPIVRKADKSFKLVGHAYLENDDGFRIQMAWREDVANEWLRTAGLSHVQRQALSELLALPAVHGFAIARDGSPTAFPAMDPRCFAIQSYLHSKPDDAIAHDRAVSVGILAQRHWEQPFAPQHLEAFPDFENELEQHTDTDIGSRFLAP